MGSEWVNNYDTLLYRITERHLPYGDNSMIIITIYKFKYFSQKLIIWYKTVLQIYIINFTMDISCILIVTV